jgi:exopolyphosphatase/pppGpp-phosphohydrolase
LEDRATFHSPFDRLMRVRTWAAERLQTVYRTVSGMMKHRKALDLLLEAELPTLSHAERQALLNSKFRLVLAVQT